MIEELENFIDENLHKKLLASAKAHGDLRHRDLDLYKLEYTTDSFYTRSLSGMSVVYCNMKKNALADQSKTIAHAVMRRF